MDRKELTERVDQLLRERNYIGAFGRIKLLPESDETRIELTGKVANAISEELSQARSQGPERIAYLRAQLAWVCRDVQGLSYLYREQIRARNDSGFDLWRSLQDLTSGRPEDAADRVKREVERGVEDARESLASGEAGDKIQEFWKDAERNVKDGVRQFGDFFGSVMRRGEDLRLQRESAKASGQPTSPESKDESPKTASESSAEEPLSRPVKIHIDGDLPKDAEDVKPESAE